MKANGSLITWRTQAEFKCHRIEFEEDELSSVLGALMAASRNAQETYSDLAPPYHSLVAYIFDRGRNERLRQQRYYHNKMMLYWALGAQVVHGQTVFDDDSAPYVYDAVMSNNEQVAPIPVEVNAILGGTEDQIVEQ